MRLRAWKQVGLKSATVASVPTKMSSLTSVKWDLVLTAKEIRIQKEADKSGSVCSVLTGGSVKFVTKMYVAACVSQFGVIRKEKCNLTRGFCQTFTGRRDLPWLRRGRDYQRFPFQWSSRTPCSAYNQQEEDVQTPTKAKFPPLYPGYKLRGL